MAGLYRQRAHTMAPATLVAHQAVTGAVMRRADPVVVTIAATTVVT